MDFLVKTKKIFENNNEIKCYANITLIDSKTKEEIVSIYDAILTWKDAGVIINTPKKTIQKIIDGEIRKLPVPTIGIPLKLIKELEKYILKNQKKLLS